MSKVLTFSRTYPAYHSRKGESTYFVEKIWLSLIELGLISKSKCVELSRETSIGDLDIYKLRKLDFQPKYHTIRKGNRWKAGDWFRPVVWGNDINPKSGRSGPYQSKQITLAPDIEVKKVWNIEFALGIEGIKINDDWFFEDYKKLLDKLAKNDGLSTKDFRFWFNKPSFIGQIICWNENINY